MAKRTKAQEGDRAVHLSTGETGTIFAIHEGHKDRDGVKEPLYSVLLDTGRKTRTLWKSTEAKWSAPPGKAKCQRCGEDGHRPIACPYGHAGFQLTSEARAALAEHGYDPRAIPAHTTGESTETFDGPTATITTAKQRVFLRMRHHVCVLDGVVVDGHHKGPDGLCTYCEEKVDG